MAVRVSFAAIVAFWVLAVPAVGLAHPLVDQARDDYQTASFEAALEKLTRAAESDDLTRTDVLELLTTRALVHFALGDQASMRADLTLLAAIEPMHDLGDDTPPSLRRALDEARQTASQPLTVALDTTREGDRVVARGNAIGYGADRIRRVEVRCRVSGADWVEGVGSVTVEADRAVAVDCEGRAIGIGGAALASGRETVAGTVPGPDETARRGGGGPGPDRIPDEIDDDDSGAPAWPWILIGGLVVAAAVGTVLAVVLLTDDQTLVTGPRLE